MLKDGLSKVALNRTDAELAPLVEPCDDPGGASAKGAFAIHENNWPTIIEARNAAVPTIGISLGTDRSHKQRLMHYSAPNYVKLSETGNCAFSGRSRYTFLRDEWATRCRLRVTGCRPDWVSGTTGVPQIPDDLLHGAKSSASGQIRTSGE
jgi:hypothetical protein